MDSGVDIVVLGVDISVLVLNALVLSVDISVLVLNTLVLSVRTRSSVAVSGTRSHRGGKGGGVETGGD